MSEWAWLLAVFAWGVTVCATGIVALAVGQPGWGGVCLITGTCWVVAPIWTHKTRDATMSE